MFFGPNVAKLEKQRDIPGLVKVVRGKDQELAGTAALALGRLLLQDYSQPAASHAVRELAQHGSAAAIAALLHCLTAQKTGWFKLKSDVAIALYDLRQTSALRDALEKMQQREALHVSLSRDLLANAVARQDSDFIEYLLVNGSWDYPSDVRSGWDFLARTGNVASIARLLEDQRLWFMYEGKRRYNVSGEQGRLVYEAQGGQR